MSEAFERLTRMQKYRKSMRSRGMRPIQIWVPDTRTEAFRLEASRQCAAVDEADRQDRSMAWLEEVGEFDDASPR